MKNLTLQLMCFVLCLTLTGFVAQAEVEMNDSISVQINKVNVNKATAMELTNIRGLGVKKAQAIVDYIKLNGPIASLDNLLEVRGIGDRLLTKLKPYLTVESSGNSKGK